MNRIKELRESKHLSQAQLAERTGSTAQQLGRLERGERGLDLVWIEKIAKAMNVKPYELLPREWQPTSQTAIDNIFNDELLNDLFYIIETINLALIEKNKKISNKAIANIIFKSLKKAQETKGSNDNYINKITTEVSSAIDYFIDAM